MASIITLVRVLHERRFVELCLSLDIIGVSRLSTINERTFSRVVCFDCHRNGPTFAVVSFLFIVIVAAWFVVATLGF